MGKCLSKRSATVQPISTPAESVPAPQVVGSWTTDLDAEFTPSSEETAGQSTPVSTAALSLSSSTDQLSGSTRSLSPRRSASPSPINPRRSASPSPLSPQRSASPSPLTSSDCVSVEPDQHHGDRRTLTPSSERKVVASGSTNHKIVTVHPSRHSHPSPARHLSDSTNKLSGSTPCLIETGPSSPTPLISSSSNSSSPLGDKLCDTKTVARSMTMELKEPHKDDHGNRSMQTLSCENICAPGSTSSTNFKFVTVHHSRYKLSESTQSLTKASHLRPDSPPPPTSSSDSKLWAPSINQKFVMVCPSRNSHPSAVHHLQDSTNKFSGSTQSLIETSHWQPTDPSPLISSSDSKLWASSTNHKFIVQPSRNSLASAAHHRLSSVNKVPGSTRSLIETRLCRPINPSPLTSTSKPWAHSSTLLGDGDRLHNNRKVLGSMSVHMGLETPEKPKKAVTQLLLNDCSDPAVPTDFYPQFHETEAEARNRRTVSQLAPRENDASARNQVQKLLVNWRESGVLSEIENHALNVPTTATTTIMNLSASLTAPPAKYLRSVGEKAVYQQLAKAYAIYFWVASNICYDIELMQINDKGGYVDCTPQHVLQQRATICAGYSNLFKALAIRAHLKADVVHGNVKKRRSTMDEDFEPQKDNSHSWNAVCIGGVWFPLDCTFASGYSADNQFSPKFIRDYFACMPMRLILTHFPSDASWQLLHDPLALEELRPLIAPTIRALANGVEPLVWSECIHIGDGSPDPVIQVSVRAEAVLRISAKLKKASLSFTSTSDDAHTDSLADDTSLDDKTFIQQTSDGYCVFAALAHPGHYALNLYSKLQHLKEQQLCLSYQISCDTTTNVQIGYPLVFALAAEEFEFQLLHWNKPQKSYVCENDEGQLAVAFRAKPGLGFSHCLIPGKEANPMTVAESSYLYHCTMISHDESNPSLYFLHALFPAEGWWTIYLCTSISLSDTTLEHSLLSYSVFSRKGHVESSYPHDFSPDVNFGRLSPLSASGYEVFVLPFTAPRDYAFLCYLTFEQPIASDKEGKLEDVVMIKKTESVPGTNSYNLGVIFPSPGKWYVHVLAKDKEDTSEKNYTRLFDLCFKVEGCLNSTFPHLTDQATEMGITFLSDEPLSASGNEVFVFPFTAPRDYVFRCHLTFEQPTPSSEEEKLNDIVMIKKTESVPGTNSYDLRVIFPSPGKWYVHVFAKDKQKKKYKYVFNLCLKVKGFLNGTFPHLTDQATEMGVTFLSDEPLSASGYEVFVLPFTAPRDYVFRCYLTFEQPIASGKEEKLEDVVMIKKTESVPGTNSYNLRVIFPSPGKWYVHVLAKDKEDTSEKNYTHLFDLCFKVEGCLNGTFPHLTDQATEMGITFLSDEPLSVSGNEVFVFPFTAPRDYVFRCHLTFEQPTASSEEEKLDDIVMIEKTESVLGTNSYDLRVIFPSPGKWYVHVFAKDKQKKKYKYVFNLCLKVKGFLNGTFPHLTGQATEMGVTFLSDEPLSASGYEVFVLPFTAPRDYVFRCYLTFEQPIASGKEGKLKDVVMIKKTESVPGTNSYNLRVIFPSPGKWYVHVLAKDKEDTSEKNYTRLFDLCLKVKGCLNGTFPHLTDQATEMGITFLSDEPLSASGNEVFVFPFTAPRDYVFRCHLTFEQPTPSSEEEKLDDIVMIKKTESVLGTNNYNLRVIFPSPGKWYVHVFAKDKQNPPKKRYKYVFNLCLKVEGFLNGTFPHLTDQAIEMGVTLLSDEPVLCINDRHDFSFQFLAPNELDFEYSVNLVSDEATKNPFLQHCVILSPALLSLNPCLYTLKGLFPYAGKWSVKLTAIAQSQRFLAIQIIVEVKTFISNLSFLKLYPKFHRLGLTVPEDRLTYSTMLNSPEFTLPFSAPGSLSFSWDLQNISTEEKFPNAIVLPSTKSAKEMADQVLHIVFPQKGEWLLQLFAQQSLVLELRVRAEAYLSDYAFPQIFKPFAKKFGLALESGSLPLVSRITTVPYTLTIPFYSPPGVRFRHKSKITNDPDTDQYTTRMISNQATGYNELIMEVVERGEWVLSLSVQLEDDTSRNWTPVLRHVITAQPICTEEDAHSDEACSDSLWDD